MSECPAKMSAPISQFHSLNELQLDRIAKSVAERKKRLKFAAGSVQQNNTDICIDITTAHSSAAHVCKEVKDQINVVNQTDFVHCSDQHHSVDCNTKTSATAQPLRPADFVPSIIHLPANSSSSATNDVPDNQNHSLCCTHVQTHSSFDTTQGNKHHDQWDEELVRQLDEAVAVAKSCINSTEENMIPLRPTTFFHSFAATPLHRDVHQYIVNNIPAPQPARRYINEHMDIHFQRISSSFPFFLF